MEHKELPNVDLGKTRINREIRVSSAAIFYGNNWFGDYYQLETFIFSHDSTIKTRMFIHFTTGREIPERYKELVKSFHRRISKILLKKYQ